MADRIQTLPPEVSERIAAGEVIERPASVVKELVENSLDAGATEIAVILEDGGKQRIEVLDNGWGMSRQDLRLSVERHATSKLKEVADLEKIKTLGFRGEALPSIAAVAALSIISRPMDDSHAYELKTDDVSRRVTVEPLSFGHFFGSPHGTRIRVEGLFAQMPARLKFLRAAAAEVAQVREGLERLALAHPQVSFRLASRDRVLFQVRAQSETERVRAILAGGEDFPLISHETTVPLEESACSLRIRAHWLQGMSLSQSRKIAQVLNGRSLKDRLLMQAIATPFRQALLPGQFPAIAVYLDLDPAWVDVNVHPTKTEVRFLDGGAVFRAVQSTVDHLLTHAGTPAQVPQRSISWPTPGISPAKSSQMTLEAPVWKASEPEAYSHDSASIHSRPQHPLSQARFVGILFHTYLLYELDGQMHWVDQHAAHERVRFEKLRKQFVSRSPGDPPLPSQQLLLPDAVSFDTESRSELESRLPLLEAWGFEVEIFGQQSVLFRAVPAAWGTEDLRIRLKNLIERLLATTDAHSPLAWDEKLFEKIASEACHSAVRAHDPLTEWQARALVEDLFECEHPWNCPHGRPTVAVVGKGKVEEWFLRKI